MIAHRDHRLLPLAVSGDEGMVRAFMTTLHCALLVIALALPNAARAGETTLAAVMSDPVGFDGQQVQVQGTLTGLRAQRSRKGDRYHAFNLSEGEHTIPILVLERPGCAAGSRVTVYGTVKRLQPRLGHDGAVMIDATEVTCLGAKRSQLDAFTALADDRRPGSCPGPSRLTEMATK